MEEMEWMLLIGILILVGFPRGIARLRVTV